MAARRRWARATTCTILRPTSQRWSNISTSGTSCISANPSGLPIEVFDGLRKALADNQSKFYVDVPSGPFYGFNRTGAQPIQAVIVNWWRQGMMGGAKAHYDGIKAFSETDFTEDLKVITVPTLVMHGDDDQIVPIADSALLSAKLVKNSMLKVSEKLEHGLRTTHADVVNPDLLAFVRGRDERAGAPGRRLLSQRVPGQEPGVRPHLGMNAEIGIVFGAI